MARFLLMVLLGLPTAAWAAETPPLPDYDTEAFCGLFGHGRPDHVVCSLREKARARELGAIWPALDPAARDFCLAQAARHRIWGYTPLLTCVREYPTKS